MYKFFPNFPPHPSSKKTIQGIKWKDIKKNLKKIKKKLWFHQICGLNQDHEPDQDLVPSWTSSWIKEKRSKNGSNGSPKFNTRFAIKLDRKLTWFSSLSGDTDIDDNTNATGKVFVTQTRDKLREPSWMAQCSSSISQMNEFAFQMSSGLFLNSCFCQLLMSNFEISVKWKKRNRVC